MMGQVELEVRDVYGTPKAYPANADAHIFALTARTKTLTAATLNACEKLGFEVVITNYPGIRWDEYRDSRGQELT